jgi:hypothetical protein
MLLRNIRILGVIVVGLLCVRGVAGQDTKIDVTGTWIFTVLSDAGTGTPTVTFKQEGEKLTGHYSSMLVGEADLKGTVKGQAIEFTVSVDVGGTAIEFKFTGTLENKDSVKGKLDTGGLGEATFTGKRKEPEVKKP